MQYIRVRKKRKNVPAKEDLDSLLSASVRLELSNSYVYEEAFHTLHESESVLREEIEEVEEELNQIQIEFREAHLAMRNDDVSAYVEAASALRRHAYRLVKEAVQVTAMADKAILSFPEDKPSTDEENWRHFDRCT